MKFCCGKWSWKQWRWHIGVYFGVNLCGWLVCFQLRPTWWRLAAEGIYHDGLHRVYQVGPVVVTVEEWTL